MIPAIFELTCLDGQLEKRNGYLSIQNHMKICGNKRLPCVGARVVLRMQYNQPQKIRLF